MALQAPRNNRPVEMHAPVDIPRTVDPLVRLRPPRHWQFEQLIVLPVEIRLPAPPRPNHNIESAAPRPSDSADPQYSPRSGRSHPAPQSSQKSDRDSASSARSFPVVKSPRIVFRVGHARISRMRRIRVRTRFLLMARSARRIARIGARRRRRVQRLNTLDRSLLRVRPRGRRQPAQNKQRGAQQNPPRTPFALSYCFVHSSTQSFTVLYQSSEFCGFSTQCPSSGKYSIFDGTFIRCSVSNS